MWRIADSHEDVKVAAMQAPIALAPVAPPRRPGRPKASPDDVVRQRIVAVATATFLARGFAGTTMDGVAREARVSKRTIYRLFPSKADLFRAMVEDHRGTMLALPRAPDDVPVRQALEEIFRLDIGEDLDRRRRTFVRIVMTERTEFPEIGAILQADGAEASRRMLAAWLAQEHERGRLSIPDADKSACMLMQMLFGVMIHWDQHFQEPWQTLVAYRREAIRVFVEGCGLPPASGAAGSTSRP